MPSPISEGGKELAVIGNSWKCVAETNNGFLRASENGNSDEAAGPLLGGDAAGLPVATVVQIGGTGASPRTLVHRDSRSDKRRRSNLLVGRERCLVFTVLGLFFTSLVSLLLLLVTSRNCDSISEGEYL